MRASSSMDGFAFLEAYHRLPRPRKHAIVVVTLTTSLHPQDVARMRHPDIAGFLNKPLTREKLDDVLRGHFERHLPPPEPGPPRSARRGVLSPGGVFTRPHPSASWRFPPNGFPWPI